MKMFSQNVDLQPYNTFGIKVIAKTFIRVTTIEELQQLILDGTLKQEPFLILGGGSNMLFTQHQVGLVIKNELKGKEIINQTADTIWLKVAAGEVWHDVVQYCVQQNWGGVENLSLIPGTTGAAPMQNIGAYGVEIKDVLESVDAIDLETGARITFSNEACKFGYRESIFKQHAKNKYFISSITLRLTRTNHQFNVSYGAIQDTLKVLGHQEVNVQSISEAVIHIRKSKLPDPAVIGNAGSFFKNPTVPEAQFALLKKDHESIPGYSGELPGTIKIPAAWLIEQCGWKGKRFDNIGVNPLQPLVLVNYGGGSGDKIWQLALEIQASVKKKFGITLIPEVNII